MRQQLSRMEADKRSVQEELGRAEQRATKLELQRMSLDGDMQRLQMVLQEKEACVKVITFYILFFQNTFLILIVKYTHMLSLRGRIHKKRSSKKQI